MDTEGVVERLSYINPFAPGDFAKKTHFEASQVVFWSLSCYKELKLTTNQFTGRTLRGLLIQNISCEVWACTESNISRWFLGLRVTQRS